MTWTRKKKGKYKMSVDFKGSRKRLLCGRREKVKSIWRLVSLRWWVVPKFGSLYELLEDGPVRFDPQ